VNGGRAQAYGRISFKLGTWFWADVLGQMDFAEETRSK